VIAAEANQLAQLMRELATVVQGRTGSEYEQITFFLPGGQVVRFSEL
jgi:hypothetical protein